MIGTRAIEPQSLGIALENERWEEDENGFEGGKSLRSGISAGVAIGAKFSQLMEQMVLVGLAFSRQSFSGTGEIYLDFMENCSLLIDFIISKVIGLE